MSHRVLTSIKKTMQRTVCALVAAAVVLNPWHSAALLAGFWGLMGSPLIALAQTPPPPERPPGAAEGQTFGQSLLRGPVTNGGQVFFRGRNGTESINTSDLFQSSGSADDVTALMEAFGDNSEINALATAINTRLRGENSQQAAAIATVRDSALTHSHPDLINDPIFARSQNLMTGEDPVFDTFFEGCTETEVPSGPGSTIHVPNPRYCSRVVIPSSSCELEHEYEAALLQVVGGEGGIENCGPGCFDVFVGRVGDNYWNGNCTIFEQNVQVQVDNPDAITSVTLVEGRWDDHMQVYLGGNLVWQGPDATSFPPETPGRCDHRTNWQRPINVDLTQQFRSDTLQRFLIRVSVGGNGEGYARLRVNYDPARLIIRDQWTITPECQALIDGISDGACSLTSITCSDGPLSGTPCIRINGYDICESYLTPAPIEGFPTLCRRGTITANCSEFNSGQMQCWTDPAGVQHCPQNDGGNPNGCQMFEDNPNCAFISSECLPFALGASGRCYAFEEHWDCGYDASLPGGTSTHVSCDGPIRCMGEDCVSQSRETNPDFARAAGTLSAMTYMAMDTNCVNGNPETCRIFAGEAMECKSALGGYQNCCEAPVSVGLADYLELTMASYDLAKKLELGTRLANAGLDVPGMWDGIRRWATNTETYQTVTRFFSNQWDNLATKYGGQAVESISNFSLEALRQQMTNATAEFVAETFGQETASMFFTQSGNTAAGEPIYSLSQNFAAVLNVIAWVYTIYLIINILIDIIWACEEEEFLLAARRELQVCTRVGQYCYDDTVFGCIETRDAYCCYSSPLARIVTEGANVQYGLTYGTPQEPICDGLTLAQIASLDWNQVDLQQWYAILATHGQIPNNPEEFAQDYALENVTRNKYVQYPTANAPERIQGYVDAAQFFDEARNQARSDLWNSAR